jgi:hypothetical protein
VRALRRPAPDGTGENGHLGFIDLPVCDFSDPRDVMV